MSANKRSLTDWWKEFFIKKLCEQEVIFTSSFHIVGIYTMRTPIVAGQIEFYGLWLAHRNKYVKIITADDEHFANIFMHSWYHL